MKYWKCVGFTDKCQFARNNKSVDYDMRAKGSAILQRTVSKYGEVEQMLIPAIGRQLDVTSKAFKFHKTAEKEVLQQRVSLLADMLI